MSNLGILNFHSQWPRCAKRKLFWDPDCRSVENRTCRELSVQLCWLKGYHHQRPKASTYTESIRKLNSNQSWNNKNQTKILSTLPITKEQKLSNAMAQEKILRWNNDMNSSTPYPFFYHTVRQTKLKGHPSIWLMFQLTLRSRLQLLYYKRRGHRIFPLHQSKNI